MRVVGENRREKVLMLAKKELTEAWQIVSDFIRKIYTPSCMFWVYMQLALVILFKIGEIIFSSCAFAAIELIDKLATILFEPKILLAVLCTITVLVLIVITLIALLKNIGIPHELLRRLLNEGVAQVNSFGVILLVAGMVHLNHELIKAGITLSGMAFLIYFVFCRFIGAINTQSFLEKRGEEIQKSVDKK